MPLALNAEPGALAAWPGVSGAVGLPHVWFGWPVVCVAVVAFWWVAVVFWVTAAVWSCIELLRMLMWTASRAALKPPVTGGPANAATERLAETAQAARAAARDRG